MRFVESWVAGSRAQVVRCTAEGNRVIGNRMIEFFASFRVQGGCMLQGRLVHVPHRHNGYPAMCILHKSHAMADKYTPLSASTPSSGRATRCYLGTRVVFLPCHLISCVHNPI